METNEMCTRARSIEEVTGEILEAKRAGGEAVLTIGRGLIEAKSMLEHGDWLSYLKDRVEFSTRQAQRFMRLAEEYASNTTPVSFLGARKALALLALPEAEREEFIEAAHVVDGEEKTVAEMSARELERAIRERDEARHKLELVSKTLESARQEAQAAQDESWKLTKELDKAEKKLAELKARPVEIAVKDATEEQLAQARAEAEEALQKDLDAANAARERAEADRDAAEAAREELSKQITMANARLEELSGAREPGAPAGDDSLPQFKLLFEQVQETVNRMHGLRLRMKDPEDAEKCSRALLALAEKIRGCAA